MNVIVLGSCCKKIICNKTTHIGTAYVYAITLIELKRTAEYWIKKKLAAVAKIAKYKIVNKTITGKSIQLK